MIEPTPEQIRIWTDAYLKGTINEVDKTALEDWYRSMPAFEVDWDDPEVNSSEVLRKKMLSVLKSQMHKRGGSGFNTRFQRLAIAATVLLFIGGVAAFILRNRQQTKPIITATASLKDVPAGVTRALLTLADGSKIVLDSAHHGQLAKQGSATIINHNGNITYLGKASQQLVFNTLSTGRGQQGPPLTLSDGTKVWLNAASSVRFPVAFSGGTRNVSITGEAYFEVTKDPAHPFIVSAGASIIKVLGTHFDVMAYASEPCTRATLLEGSIQLSNSGNQAKLAPGQQGRVNNQDGHISLHNIDVSQAVAWLHGQLSMKYMDLPAFMRQISRWYDVDVVYKGQMPTASFSGSLNKQVSLSNIITALQDNGIHCSMSNRLITVFGK